MDLRAWEYAGVLAAAADHGLDGAIWECPDVFVLGAPSSWWYRFATAGTGTTHLSRRLAGEATRTGGGGGGAARSAAGTGWPHRLVVRLTREGWPAG